MSKIYNKCYYITATKDGVAYYTEGSFTDAEISKYVNEFDIDKFIADERVDEEFSAQVEEGFYAVIRQSCMSDDEALDLGYYTCSGNTISSNDKMTPEQKAKHTQRRAEIEAEVEAEFGDVETPYVCLKEFA